MCISDNKWPREREAGPIEAVGIVKLYSNCSCYSRMLFPLFVAVVSNGESRLNLFVLFCSVGELEHCVQPLITWPTGLETWTHTFGACKGKIKHKFPWTHQNPKRLIMQSETRNFESKKMKQEKSWIFSLKTRTREKVIENWMRVVHFCSAEMKLETRCLKLCTRCLKELETIFFPF